MVQIIQHTLNYDDLRHFWLLLINFTKTTVFSFGGDLKKLLPTSIIYFLLYYAVSEYFVFWPADGAVVLQPHLKSSLQEVFASFQSIFVFIRITPVPNQEHQGLKHSSSSSSSRVTHVWPVLLAEWAFNPGSSTWKGFWVISSIASRPYSVKSYRTQTQVRLHTHTR